MSTFWDTPEPGPTSTDVLSYLGGNDASTDPDLLDLAAARLPVIRTYVQSLTRGNGFDQNGDPDASLQAVITTAAAREVNADPGVQREELGGFSRYFGPNVCEFSLREMLIINSYRRRAC